MEETIIASNRASLEKVHAVTWERVKIVTKSDPYMNQLKQSIINGFHTDSSHLPIKLQPYWRYRADLSVVDDVIMYGDRVVIPPSLRPGICRSLHSTTRVLPARLKEPNHPYSGRAYQHRSIKPVINASCVGK